MTKDTTEGSEVARIEDMDETRVFEQFKEMYVDWLRFYRANMQCLAGTCELSDPDACVIPDGCEEVERVWKLWIETLIDADRILVV